MSVSSTQLLKVYRELEKQIAAIDVRQGGPQGLRGPMGPKGRKGDKGAPGAAGKAGTQGPTGATGATGNTGAVGRPGVDGKQGPQGLQGPQGASGADGLNGSCGRDGMDGISVTDARIDFDGHLTMQMSDGTEIDAGLIQMTGDGDITYVAGGGIPDQYKRDLEQVIEDLNNHINDFLNPHQTSLENLIDTNLVDPLKEGQGLWLDDTGTWVNRAAYQETWPTGLAEGGELNIGPGVNDIEVIAGLGVTTDNYTDPLSPPVVQGVQWDQINEPITVAPSIAGSIVWFTIYDTGVAGLPIGNIPVNVGALRQYNVPPPPTLARQEIPLGYAIHNGVEWSEVSNPKVINQTAETLREVVTAVLPDTSIISGGEVSEIPSFQLDQAEGVVWENNRNWHVSKSDPNRESLPAQSPITFEYITQDFQFVSGSTTTIDPDNYDVGGTVTPVGGGANEATIQRLYIDPANNYWLMYGQTTYDTFDIAVANVVADLPEVPFLLENSLLLGYVVAEKGKNDWDPDEAVFIPASGGGASSGGGVVPLTEFTQLSDTPFSYTGEAHLVPAVNAAEDALVFEARTRAVGDYVEGVEYNRGDEVFNGSDLSESKLNGVQSYPFVAPTGPTVNVYEGTMPTDSKSAKQVIFGQRYTNDTKGFFLNGYRVYTVAGNRYEVTSVRDPLGDNIVTQIASFEAASAGWLDLPISSVVVGVGSVFDLVCTVSEPDPTPIEVIAPYDYQTPQNPAVPLAGQITQGRSLPSVLSISHTDAAAGDQTALIQGLSIGDIILLGQVQYSVQTNTPQIGYSDLVVAPALTTTPIGIQDVTFETVAPTPITIGEDPLYWDTSQYAATQGLLGVDIPYADIVPDQNAYGLDISIQEAFIPDETEWHLKVVGPLNGGGGGSGGDFTPTIFQGAGTTGYVPDPLAEQNFFLRDDGTWVLPASGGQVNTVVGGTDITVDASDPVNPIVNYTGSGFWDADGDNIYNNNIGNVGIGTDTPTQPLHVVRDAAGVVMFAQSDPTGANQRFQVRSADATGSGVVSWEDSVVLDGNSSGGLAIGDSSGTAPVKFYAGVSRTERMRVAADGNVGIGTTDPLTPFVVSNAGAEGLEVLFEAGGSRFLSYDRVANAPAEHRQDAKELIFRTADTLPFVEAMRITSDGVVTGVVNNNGTGDANTQMQYLTQAQYDAITPDANTFYFIVG